MHERLPYNEPDLLVQVAAGSEAAFRRLFENYHRRLYSYAFKFTSSNEAAEDILQDIFLKLWDRRQTLPGINNFNAYVHRMTHNEVYHFMRKTARVELAMGLLVHKVELSNGSEQLISKEIHLQIQHLVDQLTPKQREAFILSREHGLRYQEIADRMGISTGTVKTHIVEALKFLRSELGREYGSQALAIFVIWRLGNL